MSHITVVVPQIASCRLVADAQTSLNCTVPPPLNVTVTGVVVKRYSFVDDDHSGSEHDTGMPEADDALEADELLTAGHGPEG